MDVIFLHDLKIDTVIGIWDWERKIRQTVSIDLDMSADIRKAAATDNVHDTLNYKLVAKRIQEFVAESSFQLGLPHILPHDEHLWGNLRADTLGHTSNASAPARFGKRACSRPSLTRASPYTKPSVVDPTSPARYN